MSMYPLILIADDDPVVHESLGLYLGSEGYEHQSAYDGQQALEMVESLHPDMVVLDLMMPRVSGIDVCRTIRQTSSLPIIMLTAKGEEIDRILGLELGADDYIVKPFSPREVVSRIQVIFRRMNMLETAPEKSRLTLGNTEINLACYEVRVAGEAVVMSPKEVEILHLMAAHPGQVFTREQLLDSIWGFDFDGDDRVVDTSVKRIRKKLPEGCSLQLKSVYGVGYKLEAENA